jgi:cytochrome c oxidase subunit 2
MKQVPASLLTLAAGILITLVSIWIGKSLHLMPEQVSEQAPLVDNFFTIMVMIGAAVFIIVQGALLLFAIQFRQRPGDEGDGSPLEGNLVLEIVWTAIPALIVISLGIYSVAIYGEMGGFAPGGAGPMMAHHHPHHHPMAPGNSVSPANSAIAAPMNDLIGDDLMGDGLAMDDMIMDDMEMAPELGEADETQLAYSYGIGALNQEGTEVLEVGVTGLQYAWLFNYPNGAVTAELHVPIDQDVQLNIEAMDVIHSFWLPSFRLKQDAIPGQKTQLHFKATKTGTYPVVCAELCGAYHGSMRTQIVIEEPEDYQTWLAENTFAQGPDAEGTIALNTSTLSDAEFLSPYGQDWGVDAAVLSQL